MTLNLRPGLPRSGNADGVEPGEGRPEPPKPDEATPDEAGPDEAGPDEAGASEAPPVDARPDAKPVVVGRGSEAAKPRATVRPILAGGAVVTREHVTRGIEVVIIHRKRYDDWTLPKGKTEAGESIPVSAVREVLEETGVTIRLGVPLDTIRYETGKVVAGRPAVKQVGYWGGVVLSSVRRAPDAEVDVVAWLPIRAALARLTYAHDHFLVQQYLDQPPTTPLVILRHVKAMDRKDWSKKDSARPIVTRGRSQARLLVPMLGAFGVSRLVSSTAVRCVNTLLPYAASRDLVVESHAKLTEEEGAHDPKGVRKVIQAVRQITLSMSQPTAICVHRPVLPHILDALGMAPMTLVTGEFLVAHLTSDGSVHAVERHRPLA